MLNLLGSPYRPLFMKKFYLLYCFVLSLLPVLAQALPQTAAMEFIENRGQWQGPFRYRAVSGNEAVYLSENSFTYMLGAATNGDYAHAFKHGEIKQPPLLKYHAYKVSFEGANASCRITGSKQQQHYYNYFLGQDSTRWQSGIHPYMALDYAGLYNGIDMHVSSDRGSLKYEFIVAPGADLSQLRLRFEGQDALSVKEGNLVIGTSVGEVQEMKPYTYQVINGEKKKKFPAATSSAAM